MTGKEKDLLEIEFYRTLRSYIKETGPATSAAFWTTYGIIKSLWPDFPYYVCFKDIDNERHIKVENKYKDNDTTLLKLNPKYQTYTITTGEKTNDYMITQEELNEAIQEYMNKKN